MLTRLTTLLLAVLLIAAFAVAGCGDDESDGGSGGDTAAETSATEPATEPDTATEEAETPTDTPEADGDSGGAVAPPDLGRTVETCKKRVRQAPQISDDAQSKLEDLCEKAGSTDPDEIRETAREVCETLVRESVPEGAARDQALEACRSAGR